MEKYCVPTEMFYPLNWDEALHFLLPERNEFIKKKCVNAAFVHLWNEGLRRQAVRKDLYPPEGSFLSDQFKRHGITFPSGLSYTEREIQFMNGNSFIARHRMELERNSALQAYESCKRALESVRAEGHQKIDNSINNTLSVKFDALDATLKAIAQGVPTNTSLSAKVDELCQAFHEIRRQIAEIHEVTSWHRKALRPVRWLWKQLLPIRQKIAQARIRSRQERAMED
jgi:hypothetical protein